MGRKQKKTPKIATVLVKREMALRLRCAGLTFEQIGQRIGCCGQTAGGYVQDAIDDLKKKIVEGAEDLRAIMLAQCDEAHAAWWPKAVGIKRSKKTGAEKEIDPDRFAIDRVLRIMDRKMELLGITQKKDDDAPNPLANEMMRQKAQAYKQMGLADLTRLFTDMVKAPIAIEHHKKTPETITDAEFKSVPPPPPPETSPPDEHPDGE